MSTALQPFDFAGQQVRVVTDEYGDPHFVAGDVARILGYRDAHNMARRVDDEDKGTHSLSTPGGDQIVAVLTEAGLYAAIIGSQVPGAKAFKRWVTHDVLPEIRKTGGYSVPDLTTPAGVLAMAEQFTATARALVASEAKVAELAPKADLADTFLISDGSTRLVREAAKLLGVREGDLRRFLLDEKLIFVKHAPCGVAMYDFYAAHAHHFVVKENPVEHAFGLCSHYTLRITARGVELIRKRLRDAAERRELVVGGVA